MIAQMRSPVLIPRRQLLLFPLALLLHARAHGATLASSVERELIATVERDAGLLPPLTLGIARVVLRPGASAFAATPNGARMIVVESGVLAVASLPHEAEPLTSAELGVSAPAPDEGDELFVPGRNDGHLRVARGGSRAQSRRPLGRRARCGGLSRGAAADLARLHDRGRDQLPAPGQRQRRGRSCGSRRFGAGAVAARGVSRSFPPTSATG